MWIKDIEGNILNTDFTCGIYLYKSVDSTYEVIATIKEPGFNEPVLFKGTEEECKEYIDKLMMDLNGQPYLVPDQSYAEVSGLYGQPQKATMIGVPE